MLGTHRTCGRRLSLRVAGGAGLLVALYAIWFVLMPTRSLPAWASGEPYEWWTETDNNGYVSMHVLPVNKDDWTDYMAASNNRLDDWLTNPAASDFGGMYVQVSFTEPVSLTRFNTVIGPLLGTSADGEIAQHVTVSRDQYGRWGGNFGAGAPDASLFGAGVEPWTGIAYQVVGLIEGQIWLGSGVDVVDLDWVRDQPDVYLMDTTFIAAALDFGQPVEWFMGDAPWPDLSPNW